VFKVVSSVRIISFRASELEDTYHFRNGAELEKSDGTEELFSQTVFDLQVPRAYRTIGTIYVKPQRYQRWIHDGTRVRSMPPTMLARPFYPVGILDGESRGGELVQ